MVGAGRRGCCTDLLYSAIYTLDVLIPAPALGQASDFDPQGAGLPVATGLHILGWLLAITVIAAITR
jgi:hypothetical protein